jgi:hypothetical protein
MTAHQLLTPDHCPDTASGREETSLNDILQELNDSFGQNPDAKKRKYVHLSAKQFSAILQCFQQQQNVINNLLQ